MGGLEALHFIRIFFYIYGIHADSGDVRGCNMAIGFSATCIKA